jgi:hypothetical protein
MMPVLGIIGRVGAGGRSWYLPLPLFILWPLVLVALGGLAIGVWIGRSPSSSSGGVQRSRPPVSVGRGVAAARLALHAFCQLKGLKIDVKSSSGEELRLWFI